MRTLIIAAHPDDEVLGCGGTIARLFREGHDVFIAILGEGITSRAKRGEVSNQTEVIALHKKSRQIAKLLGAKDLVLHQFPDNRFDTVPLLDIVKVIEDLISTFSPEIIYTHHGGDLNVDHTIVHRAVLTATRPMKERPVREIYVFEVPSSTEWAFHQFEPHFRPNVFMEISETLSLKIKAMSLYKTESRIFPHPRSPEMMQAIARRWGSVAGCEAAEAFELIRAIR